jgi:hypothetical protein
LGDQLVAIGERLITIGTDGTSGFDLGLVRDWLNFRDEQNTDLSAGDGPIAQADSDKSGI